MGQDDTQIVSAKLPDGTTIRIQAVRTTREQLVGIPSYDLEAFLAGMRTLSHTIVATLKDIAPDRAEVEFGVNVGIETGQLTSLLAKGASGANLKITLEWCRESTKEPAG
jgi:hypothetical protein